MEDRKKIEGRTLPEALGAYARKNAARFHMPGHKGRGMSGFWRSDLIEWDVTELSNTDNLHHPTQAIACAQNHMAVTYGAKASYFVVNGSTAAVQAMILSLSSDDRLLLSRDAHKSAAAGVVLSGIAIDYLFPDYNDSLELYGFITPEALDSALTETGATAVLITSPNYYGLCADIPALSKIAHAHDALLLVDGAHGAHFPFSESLPTGLSGYADLWAHSQHKTMDALTQAASLHLGECRISPEQVQRVLTLLETSSPSYLLMTSLDWSVYMGTRQDWTGQVRRMNALRKRICEIDGMALLPDWIGAGVAERDSTRLVIDVTGRGLTGFTAAALLEKQNIFIEMADARRLVLITSPEDDPVWYNQLLEALDELPRHRALPRTAAEIRRKHEILSDMPTRRLSPREAVLHKLAYVPIGQAAGRVVGESIGAYPPGISLVMPGEELTERMIQYLLEEERVGATLFGVRNGGVFVVD
ncbi:MAG: aminotransferase class V-fold PLP-dependent enzyme [Clostridia bacterium]